MRRLFIALVAAALLPLAVAPAAPPAKKPVHAAAPAARDWTQVATRLPSGTFMLGNPAARVKLVEFLSLTCPHCAHMEEVAVPSLTRDYIRTGKVSYEVRPAVRDGLDLAATVLARCNGPKAFFAVLPPLFAAQDAWITKVMAWQETAPPTDGKSNSEKLAILIKGAGLDAFFASHGMPPARQAACLKDERDAALITKAAQAIWTPGFPGTPAFEINGKAIGTIGSWEDLKAKLVEAGA